MTDRPKKPTNDSGTRAGSSGTSDPIAPRAPEAINDGGRGMKSVNCGSCGQPSGEAGGTTQAHEPLCEGCAVALEPQHGKGVIRQHVCEGASSE